MELSHDLIGPCGVFETKNDQLGHCSVPPFDDPALADVCGCVWLQIADVVLAIEAGRRATVSAWRREGPIAPVRIMELLRAT